MQDLSIFGRHLDRDRVLSVLLLLLALPLLWSSLIVAPSLRVDVGVWGDHTVLSNINGIERGAGEDYRWTAGRAELALPNLSSRYQLLRLRAHGWRPEGQPAPLVQLEAAGRPWGSMQTSPTMRRYQLLLPRVETAPEVRVGFDSPLYHPPGDPRQLGFAIDWIELGAVGDRAEPSLWQFGGQLLLLGLLALLFHALTLPRAVAPLLTALCCGALIGANMQQPLWVSQGLGSWLILVVLLLLATWLLAPRLQQWLAPWMVPAQARLAWALFVAALGLRMAGSIHPLFNAHDVDVHMRWLNIVAGGQLYLYSTPAEFHNRLTFNPPGGYMLLLPLWLLLPSPRLVVQIGVALFDALGCFVLLPLARELRLPASAALLGLALYLALPINMTMLWWGFATNALAQSLWLLLLWALLRLSRQPDRAGTAIVTVLGAVCLLTHVGALVVVLAMLGLWLLLSWRQLNLRARRAALGGGLAVLLFAIPIYFTVVLLPVLTQEASPERLGVAALLAKGWADRAIRFGLVSRGWLLGFTPLPLLLALPGLIWLFVARRRHALQPALLVAWPLICVGFMLVYFGLGYVTRYIYFATPLLCLAVGALLAALGRYRGGRTLVLATALFVIWVGVTLWIAGVLLRVPPSAVPLTH